MGPPLGSPPPLVNEPHIDHREGVIDAFLFLLIGVGRRLALVPYVEITTSHDTATKRRVQRCMRGTAAPVSLIMVHGSAARSGDMSS